MRKLIGIFRNGNRYYSLCSVETEMFVKDSQMQLVDNILTKSQDLIVTPNFSENNYENSYRISLLAGLRFCF
ncbi:MAG: hypothetical protein LBR28_02375 [Bacteroidales bacterium]|nr:hypothetical protein [Bacteroidales bacterium]